MTVANNSEMKRKQMAKYERSAVAAFYNVGKEPVLATYFSTPVGYVDTSQLASHLTGPPLQG